jgi:hypothetical protein
MGPRDFVTRLAGVAFAVVAWVFVGCLVVQLFLVGLDAFEVTAESTFHREFAYLYGWLAPLLVLLAAVGRLSGFRQAQAAALLILFAIQTYLPTLAEVAPLLAAVHAVNALAISWLAVHLAISSRAQLAPLFSDGG